MIGFAIETSKVLGMKTWTRWFELGTRECLQSPIVWVFSSKGNSIFFEGRFPSWLHTFDGKFSSMGPPYAKKLIIFLPSNQVYRHHGQDQYCLSNRRWRLGVFYYQSIFYIWVHRRLNWWRWFRTERALLIDISS